MGIQKPLIKSIQGTGVALVTPFQKNGAIDFVALEKILVHTADGGIDYFVVLGTTGEPATLSQEEKKEVLRFVADHNPTRIPLVAGIGGNNTEEIIQNLRYFPLENYSAILSVSPYYNKPSQEGIYRHYKALSEASNLPILIYNVPGRTGTNILAETTLRMANDLYNIMGIKEASGLFDQFTEILRHKPQSFQLISGDDALAVPMISIGATGLISVLANSHPKECSDMVNKALQGDLIGAGKDHIGMSSWIPLLFKESNPTGVKAILNALNLCEPQVRLPLVPASTLLTQEIQTKLLEPQLRY